MKAADLNQALHDHFSKEELTGHFSIRGYRLTPKGENRYSKTIKQSLTAIQRRIFNQPSQVDFFENSFLKKSNQFTYEKKIFMID